MGTINVTYLPCTKAIPTGAQTIVCTISGKQFRMEIPDMMFTGTIWLRFYSPYTTRNHPTGYTVAGKTYEVVKVAGPEPTRGYTFRFETPFTSGTQSTVDLAQSVDDGDPGNWIPATGRSKWINQSGFMGGRFGLFYFFANFKKDQA
ncbi:MAG: hypothetical protein GXP54_06045 [Deltaproteobacteria bacterium]|nr:hypothetical protein [Deltaproteobacteria bacterium]